MGLKAVVFGLCVVFVLGSVLSGPIAQEILDKCMNEHEVDKDTLEKFNVTRPLHTDDDKVKCFLKCALMGAGYIDSEGNLVNKAPENPVEQEHQPYVSQCLTTTGSDVCDKAYNFHKCVIEKKEAH